jgi:ubiquinone/menaquinone biosynthesis C-methylase UbiE
MFHPKGPTLLELARQGLSSTQRGYDLLAPKFDFTPFRTPEEILDGVYQLLVQLGPFADGIDLCCGTGAGVRMLQPLCKKRVVGLDFSVGMLAEARRQDPGPSEGWCRAELVWSDVLDMSYEGLFDIATCFGALGHIPRAKQKRFLENVHRALRPGGLFVFVTAPMPPAMSRSWMFGHGYNALAHVRNFLKRPHFDMLYLTFTVEEAQRLLQHGAFSVEIVERIFPKPHERAAVILARKLAIG